MNIDNPQFTETLETLLENQGYGTAEQSADLTEILTLMGHFPNFVINPGDEESAELNFTTMFIQKFDIREIGAKTEELFMHFWREKTNDLIMKYVPKMIKWTENFNDLFKFTVKLVRDDTNNISNNNQNTYYLNPVNATTTNLKVQDVDKSEGGRSSAFHSERDVLQSVWGKTRADIMEKILDLKNIFNDCLYEYEEIFMGVF